jgi:hypothetical protein
MQIFPSYDPSLSSNRSSSPVINNGTTPPSVNSSHTAHTIAVKSTTSSSAPAPAAASNDEDDVPVGKTYEGIISPRIQHPSATVLVPSGSKSNITRRSFSQATSVSVASSPSSPQSVSPLSRRSFTAPVIVGVGNDSNAVTLPPISSTASSSALVSSSSPSTTPPRRSGTVSSLFTTQTTTLLYSKTIGETTKDQQYLLTPNEYSNGCYKYLHKLIFVITQAITLLAKDHFIIASLAITGLTKLAIKNTMNSLINIDDSSGQRSDQIVGIIPVGPLIRRRSSFMIATNALSESSEEGMLKELKHELNINKWIKLLSLGDIISSSLRFSNDSVSRITKFTRSSSSTGILPINGGPSGSKPQPVRMKSRKDSFSNKDTATVVVANGGMTLSPVNSVSQVTTAVDQHRKNSLTNSLSAPNLNGDGNGNNGNNSENNPVILHSVSRDDEAALKPSFLNTGDVADGGKQDMKTEESAAASAPPKSFLGSSPTATATKTAGTAANKRGNVNFKTASLRQNTDAEYVKSKKMASNLIAQLLLDFLETRKDPVFSEDIINELVILWKKYGDIYDHNKSMKDDGKDPVTFVSCFLFLYLCLPFICLCVAAFSVSF